MNWDRIEGNWKQLKGKAKEQWGKLTDDDFDVIAGRRDQLAGKIQERYGVAKEEAEKQVSSWERSAKDDWFTDGGGNPPRH
ncbi:MAG: CsbD family protein [Methylibium sp.]|nr:CsbD family protein [Methylibium sp.]